MKEKRVKRKLKKEFVQLFRTGLKTVGRFVAALIAILLVFEGINFPAHAEEGGIGEVPQHIDKVGKKMENTYILETTTGTSDGSMIEYLLIKYKNKAGAIKRHYIFPGQDSLSNGQQIATAVSTENGVLQKVYDVFGYELTEGYISKKALQPYKTDQFLFRLPEPIDEVVDIRALTNSNGTWTCLGLRIFSVEELYGYQMAGVWSDTGYIDFKGMMIAELNPQSTSQTAPRIDDFSLGPLRTQFAGYTYAIHETQDTNVWGFRLDFADYYKDGMEGQINEYADQGANILDMKIAETLTYNITYKDIYGQSRIIHLPACTSTALWLSDEKRIGNTPTLGFGQQGGTMAFTADIPDCLEILYVSVSGGAKAAKLDGRIQTTNSISRVKAREDYSEKDSMRYTCFAVYDMKRSSFRPHAEGALLKYDYIGSPELFHKTGTDGGDVIDSSGVTQIPLSKYDNRPLEYKKGDLEGYLVQLTTDDIEAAATAGEISIRFKYLTMTGQQKETGEYNLKDATNNYYGYWPGSVEDFPYHYGFSAGGTLNFIIQVPGVDYFTGAVVTLNGEKADDYQFSSFKVYNISNSGTLKAEWKNVSQGGVSSRVYMYREIDGKELSQSENAKIILNIDEPVLIMPGTSQKLDFVSNSVGELEDNSFDPNTLSMTYQEAMQNYGFAKSRKTYDVEIKVAEDVFPVQGDTISVKTGDGDSGSKNNFYFQLKFENGASAFVLANHQLHGDYFRSGSIQNIVICTNHDYGDVQELRIIADESTEDLIRTDKLNLDYVRVSEGNKKGTHKAWEFNDIKWIGADYSENLEKLSITGKSGKSLSELAKCYSVSQYSNVVDMEISIQTAYGNKETERNPSTGAVERIYADQLEGKATIEIEYLDNAGLPQKTGEVDMVKKMYSYMGKTPQATGTGLAMSDPAYMFRELHTDRFTVSLSNVKKITGIKLYVESKNKYQWRIAGISGRLIKETGRLRINKKNEYQYEFPNSGEESVVFNQASTSNPAYTLDVTSTGQSLKLAVDSEEINVNPQGDTAVSYVRVPASNDDTLNVYVFPSYDADPMSLYDVNCSVQYTTSIGNYQVSEPTMNKFNADNDETLGRPMYYIKGLSASRIVDVDKLVLKAGGPYAKMCNIDFAIVQQVRGGETGLGTIVKTYFFDFNGANATYGIETTQDDDRSVLGYTEDQVVTFEFGPGTGMEGLVPERKDVGFAIEYTNTFDPLGVKHRSPIVYLSDQQIASIREGMTVDLKFHELFVKEITGLYAVASGDNKAVVKSACVATYRTETGSVPRNMGWYSFANGIALNGSLIALTRTAEDLTGEQVVVPVTLTFKTSEAADDFDSGTRDAVQCTVIYVDNQNYVMPGYLITDLRKYLTDGSQNFEAGKTQTVRFMMSGAQSIRRITIEPKSANLSGTAGWSIDSASLKFGDSDIIPRTVKKRFFEDEPQNIVFANISVGATVHNYNSQKKANEEHHVNNNTLNIIVEPGQSVYVAPVIHGSEYGYTIKAYEVTSDDFISGELVNSLTDEGGRYKFTPDNNTTTTSKYYRIVVAATEAPESKAVINISIGGATQEDIASKAIQQYSDKMTEEQKKQQLEQYKNNWATTKHEAISGYQNGLTSSQSEETKKLYKSIIAQLEALNYDESKSFEENVAAITRIVNQKIADTEKAAQIDEFNQYKETKKQYIDELKPECNTRGCPVVRAEAKAFIDSCTDYTTDYKKIGDMLNELPDKLDNQVKLDNYKDQKKSEASTIVPEVDASAERVKAMESIEAATTIAEIDQIIGTLEITLNQLLTELNVYKNSMKTQCDNLVPDATGTEDLRNSAKANIDAAKSKEEIDAILAGLEENLKAQLPQDSGSTENP